jgi:hypothetical protein
MIYSCVNVAVRVEQLVHRQTMGLYTFKRDASRAPVSIHRLIEDHESGA